MHLEGVSELGTVLGAFSFYPVLTLTMMTLAWNSEKKLCSAFMSVGRVQLFTVSPDDGRRVLGVASTSEPNVILTTQYTDTGLKVERSTAL